MDRKLLIISLLAIFTLVAFTFAILQLQTPDISVVVGVPTSGEDSEVPGINFAAYPLRNSEEVRIVMGVLLQGREVQSPEFDGMLPDAVLKIDGPEKTAYFVDVWLKEDSIYYAFEGSEKAVFHKSNVYVEKLKEILGTQQLKG